MPKKVRADGQVRDKTKPSQNDVCDWGNMRKPFKVNIFDMRIFKSWSKLYKISGDWFRLWEFTEVGWSLQWRRRRSPDQCTRLLMGRRHGKEAWALEWGHGSKRSPPEKHRQDRKITNFDHFWPMSIPRWAHPSCPGCWVPLCCLELVQSEISDRIWSVHAMRISIHLALKARYVIYASGKWHGKVLPFCMIMHRDSCLIEIWFLSYCGNGGCVPPNISKKCFCFWHGLSTAGELSRKVASATWVFRTLAFFPFKDTTGRGGSVFDHEEIPRCGPPKIAVHTPWCYPLEEVRPGSCMHCLGLPLRCIVCVLVAHGGAILYRSYP